MTRLVDDIPTVGRLVESTVEADCWDERYPHQILLAHSIGRQSLLLVATNLDLPRDDVAAYTVKEHQLAVGTTDYEVLSATVDQGRLLWLQLLNPAFEAGRFYAQQAPRYEQRRIEMRLDQNDRARQARLNIGTLASHEFESIGVVPTRWLRQPSNSKFDDVSGLAVA